MNVALFGAAGMVGAGVVLECVSDPRVTSVLAIEVTVTGYPKHELCSADFNRLAATT